MKRFLFCLLVLLALSTLLTSCKDDAEDPQPPTEDPAAPEEAVPDDGIPDASYAGVEIEELTFRYLTESEYNEGNFSDELLRETASFKDGDHCYMVVDLTYHKKNDGLDAMNLEVRFGISSRGVLDMRIEEAATSTITEEKDVGGVYCTLSYTVPALVQMSKSERIILRLMAVSGGEAELSVQFGKNDSTNLVSGKCTKQIVTGEREFTFELNYNGLFYILRKAHVTSAERVEIPEKLGDGIPVSYIAERAFEGFVNLKEIVIPETVTGIGESAFFGCTSLETLVIHSSMTSIGAGAFSECTGLASLEILTENASIGSNAFPEHLTVSYSGGVYIGNTENPYLILIKAVDKSVTEFAVHSDTKILAASAFYNCSAMTAVDLPPALTTVGHRAFRGCSALAAVTLPDTVCKMGDEVFKGCASLTSIKIPDLVQYIGASAFQECTALASVTLPASLLRIESTAFAACWALHTLTLPVSLQFVGQYAFAGCGALSVLTYEGTATQWNALYKHDLWQGSAVIATVVCSDGTVTL